MNKVIFCFSLYISLFSLKAQTVNVSIDASNVHQTIEGFGATTQPLVYGTADYLGASRPDVLDKLYNQVKLTMGNITTGNNEMDSSLTFGTSVNDDNDPFNYNWAGFNFKYSQNDTEFIINPSIQYGFNNYMLQGNINTKWSCQWMNALRTSNYNQYLDECAEHVIAIHKYWRDNFGIIQPYAFLFNEPLTGNQELTSGGTVQEVVDIIKRVGDRFRAEGFDSIMLVAPNEETITQTIADVTAILADSVARSYVGAVGYHTYPYGSPYAGAGNILAQSGTGNPDANEINKRTTLKNMCSAYNIPVWFTEVCCGGLPLFSMDLARARAIHIHDEFLYADASAYFGMNAMWDYQSQLDHFGNANSFYNEAEIVLIDSTGASFITGEGYAIGHYARWLKKGAKRIEATSTDSLVQISSFKDESSNTFTIVAINNNTSSKTVQFNFSGINLTGQVNGEQSYDTLRWEAITPVTSSSGGFAYTLEPNSVTSFSGSYSISTEISQAVKTSSLELYPNPANNTFVVKDNAKIFDLAITDFAGRILFESKNVSSSIQVDAKYPSGVYFLKANYSDGHSLYKKLAVEN